MHDTVESNTDHNLSSASTASVHNEQQQQQQPTDKELILKGAITKRTSPFNFSDDQKFFELRWYKASFALKSESSKIKIC